MKVTQSCPTLQPHGLHSPWNSPGQNTEVGSRFLLQGIFPIQGSNPGLPHCRQTLYQLNHQGSPYYVKHCSNHLICVHWFYPHKNSRSRCYYYHPRDETEAQGSHSKELPGLRSIRLFTDY